MGIFDYFFEFFHEETATLAVPNAATLQRILHEIATPVFQKMNIQPTNNVYRWASDYNEHGIQKVIQFRHRAAEGNFLIGTNFKFMPVINSKQKIVYKRKELHLYESFNSMIPTKHKISLWNEKLFEISLKKQLKKQASRLDRFFLQLETVPQNRELTQKQLQSKDGTYTIREPNLNYILAFLKAKLGEKEKATELLHAYLNTYNEAPSKILAYLEKL